MPELKYVARVCICYDREDKELLKGLLIHLEVLHRQGLIEYWYDGYISPGESWEEAIYDQITHADIVLPLISPAFMAQYYSQEMKLAVCQHYIFQTRVIPILLRPVYYQSTPFAYLPSLPSNKIPVTSWENHEDAFFRIAEGVRLAAERLWGKHDSPEAIQERLDEPASLKNRSSTMIPSARVRMTDSFSQKSPEEMEQARHQPLPQIVSQENWSRLIQTLQTLLFQTYWWIRDCFSRTDYAQSLLGIAILFGPGFELGIFQRNWGSFLSTFFLNLFLVPFISGVLTIPFRIILSWLSKIILTQEKDLVWYSFPILNAFGLCVVWINATDQITDNGFFLFLCLLLSFLGGLYFTIWFLTTLKEWKRTVLMIVTSNHGV